MRQAMAEILKTKPIAGPGRYTDDWIGTSYLTRNNAGLRVILHVEIYGRWRQLAKGSSDPDVRALVPDNRLELVKRLSDKETEPGEFRVFVAKVKPETGVEAADPLKPSDTELRVLPGTRPHLPRFEQD